MSESKEDEVTRCIVSGTGPNVTDAQDMLAMVKNLDKISEIDENELYADSRGLSNLARENISRSRATFRTTSYINQAADSQSDGEADNEDEDEKEEIEKPKKKFLLTEIDQCNSSSEYNSDDDDETNDDDDNDLVLPKAPAPVYENDIYNEKDWETDLEGKDTSDEETYTPKQMYKKMCEELNVIPCRYFLAHIEKEKIVMRYHQFSNDEIRAMSKPLWNNFQVEKLLLDGNWIEENGAKYLSRMIRMNDFITELSLADNRVGESVEGTKEVCRMISEDCKLKKLNLSGNGFGDRDVEPLIAAFEKNKIVSDLNLRHNNFGDDCGKLMGNYISSNDTLTVLDLSWNNLRAKSAKEVGLGVKENVRLKKCDLSYNGFDADAGKSIGEIIKNNTSLEHLLVSNCRLNADCAATIANALEVNDTLKHLNMTNNPITTSGALAIIYAIKLNTSSILETLDLSEIPVTKEFENVLKEIQEGKPEFKCMRGPVIMTSNTKSILYEGGSKVDFEKIITSLKGKA